MYEVVTIFWRHFNVDNNILCTPRTSTFLTDFSISDLFKNVVTSLWRHFDMKIIFFSKKTYITLNNTLSERKKVMKIQMRCICACDCLLIRQYHEYYTIRTHQTTYSTIYIKRILQKRLTTLMKGTNVHRYSTVLRKIPHDLPQLQLLNKIKFFQKHYMLQILQFIFRLSNFLGTKHILKCKG